MKVVMVVSHRPTGFSSLARILSLAATHRAQGLAWQLWGSIISTLMRSGSLLQRTIARDVGN